MTLPASGAISFADINTELGYAPNAAITLNDTAVRNLAGKPSGVISLSDLYGKSAVTYKHSIGAFSGGYVGNSGGTYFENLTIGVGWVTVSFSGQGSYYGGDNGVQCYIRDLSVSPSAILFNENKYVSGTFQFYNSISRYMLIYLEISTDSEIYGWATITQINIPL